MLFSTMGALTILDSEQDAFGATMPHEDISKRASCTTCHFKEDLSNYWTANLYFKARNGTYKRVPQIANQFNNPDNAGLTVYYTSPGPNRTVAFKPVGDPGSWLWIWLLTDHVRRDFACSREMHQGAHLKVLGRICNNAIAALRSPALAAACTRRAWIRYTTPTISPLNLAPGESAPTSYFLSKS